MGRTLSYEIKKESNFNQKEMDIMYNISMKYNSGKFEDVWSCENFFLDPYNFYPVWDRFPDMPTEKGWESVYENIKDQTNKGISRADAIKSLASDQQITLARQLPAMRFSGFTKVQGNEYNALLVLLALSEISVLIPSATITLSDEGQFLLCPIRIKKGKAIPLLEDVFDDIKWCNHVTMFSKNYEHNILAELGEFAEGFTYEFKMDIKLGNTYGDMIEGVKKKLRNLKIIDKRLGNSLPNGSPKYFMNIEHLEHKYWYDPMMFTRSVNVEKYLSYKMTPATLMDGFDGDGFGLSDKDSEAESYRSIAMIMNIMKPIMDADSKLVVLGEK